MVNAEEEGRDGPPAGTAAARFFSPFLPLCPAALSSGVGAEGYCAARGAGGRGREREGGTGLALVSVAAPGGRGVGPAQVLPAAASPAARAAAVLSAGRPRRAGLRQRRLTRAWSCLRVVPVRASLCRVLPHGLRLRCGGSSQPAAPDRAAGAAACGRGGGSGWWWRWWWRRAALRALSPLGASTPPALVWSSEAPALGVLPRAGGAAGAAGQGDAPRGPRACAPAVVVAAR